MDFPSKQDIKLVVVDIDGTISGHSNHISQGVKEAIASVQAQGIPVAIATGRMYCSALRFHQDICSTLPLIAYQGAWIQDPISQKVHQHLVVSPQITHQLLDYFDQPQWNSLLSIHLYIDDQLYVRKITWDTEIYAQRCAVNPIVVGDLHQVLDQAPTKVLALCADAEVTRQLLGDLRRQYTPAELYLTTSVSTFFEATNPFVNKGNAVRYLAEELLGINSHNVMTIGDNFNDVEMLEYAGLGVAMGDAPDGVKAIANWIAPSVEADGVAVALEKFLLS